MRTLGTVGSSVRLLFPALLLSLGAFLTPSACAEAMYDVTEMPSEWSSSPRAYAINRLGQVAGVDSVDSGTAILWNPGGPPTELDLLPGGWLSSANGINDAGQVVGYAYDYGGDRHPCLWNASGNVSELGTLGGPYGEATDINNSGKVVGSATTATGALHPFIWDPDHGMQDLVTLGAEDPDPFAGISAAAAYAINDVGQVVGIINGTDPVTGISYMHVFRWDPSVGKITDLGAPEGAFWLYVTGINDAGQIVGYYVSSDGYHSYLWDKGDFTDLDPPPGTSQPIARGINNNGQIAGEVSTGSSTTACLWSSGLDPFDLGALLGGGSSSAYAISNGGQVAGYLTNYWDGEHAFVAVPLNQPPVAVPDSYTTAEDTPLIVTPSEGLLANDSGGSSDPLNAILIGSPEHGLLNLSADGSFTYTPDANFNGTDAFTYVANDGRESSGAVTVTITVTAVNDPPTFDGAPGSVEAVEGAPASVDLGAFSDPEANGPWSVAVKWGDESASTTMEAMSTGSLGALSHTFTDNGTYEVSVVVTDKDGASGSASVKVQVKNVAPSAVITGPVSGTVAPVNKLVSFAGRVEDPGIKDSPKGTWTFAQGIDTTPTTVAANSGADGLLTLDHSFDTPGVYAVSLSVKDKDGADATADSVGGLPAYIVIYDPSEAFVTGGGWINSPPGASAAAPSLAGKASFGFVARYRKGATVLEGHTEFKFQAAGMTFRSTAMEWLVVSGSRAQVKGTGVVNGAGDYGFMLTAMDGQFNGGSERDRLRMKVWDRVSGAVVYDNLQSVSDSADLADGTELGGGSIVIHTR